MSGLHHYLYDGANYQARAVLAILQHYAPTGDINVARWENRREQGYVIYARDSERHLQLNIAFFEHRNSDEIVAVRWEQSITINSPTIETAQFGGVYADKYDVSFSVPYGQIVKMAKYIAIELVKFLQPEGE